MKNPLRNESGQSVVELAIVMPLIVLIILALVDFGRALNMYLAAEHAASDGARLAAVDYVPASGTLAQYLQQNLISGELQTGSGTTAGAQGAAKVCISFPNGTNKRGDPITVVFFDDYRWIPGGFIPGSARIAGAATMRLEQDSSVGPARQCYP